jgi:hypothetical protein
MAHHKRGKPKKCRAGCNAGKYWKTNGFSIEKACAEKFGSHWRRKFAGEEIKALRVGAFRSTR